MRFLAVVPFPRDNSFQWLLALFALLALLPFALTQDAVTSVSFSIASSDRIAGRKSVPVTLAFAPTAHIPSGDSITLSFPLAFFASDVTPTVDAAASSITNFAAVCNATTASSIVVRTSGAAIGLSAFTVTIRGFTMGASTLGSNSVTVQTSNSIASAPVHSGIIRMHCEEGSFAADSSTSLACTLCPPGTYNPRNGSFSRNACLPCPAGRYCLEGCISSRGSGKCSVGTYSSLGNGTNSSCFPCPSSFYCSGPDQPKFAAFFRLNSSFVYYPSIQNPVSTQPSLHSNPISLAFTAGKYVNLGTVVLQPSHTGFSATLVAKYNGGQGQWSRFWEFGWNQWNVNIILSRFEYSDLVRFESFQRDQYTNSQITQRNGWSSTGMLLSFISACSYQKQFPCAPLLRCFCLCRCCFFFHNVSFSCQGHECLVYHHCNIQYIWCC
jgi:hypothetical protein